MQFYRTSRSYMYYYYRSYRNLIVHHSISVFQWATSTNTYLEANRFFIFFIVKVSKHSAQSIRTTSNFHRLVHKEVNLKVKVETYYGNLKGQMLAWCNRLLAASIGRLMFIQSRNKVKVRAGSLIKLSKRQNSTTMQPTPSAIYLQKEELISR